MKENYIKPIPKYIVKKIKKYDLKYAPIQDGHIRFYSYLAIWHKELVQVTVAVKNKYKKWYCKQVAIHGLDSEICFVKDMEYCGYVGMGYRVGWYEQGLQKYRNWFESKNWCYAKDKYYNPYAPVVNIEVVDKLPEFKFSHFREYYSAHILKFLRIYRQYPEIEYFMKQGLKRLVNSKMILKLARKDKKFCKWLVNHKDEVNSYQYITAIINAYKNNTTIQYEDIKTRLKYEFKHGDFCQFKQHYICDFNKLIDYIIKQNTSMSNYIDYYNACEHIGLDMGQEKNRFPHDFRHWHDMRIDEYRTAKALADKQERQEMYRKFEEIANKYRLLEKSNSRNYVCIIAKNPYDLINEGKVLHHCVGNMNYDQKFIREESLIFFIRNKDSIDIPFVTLEYSLKTKSILQCYAELDSKPADDVLDFVNNKWLPYANRKLNKILKAVA